MSNHLETYGSAKLRVLFLDDEKEREIEKDTLFENLYDFWTAFHDPNKSLFYWYGQENLDARNVNMKEVELSSFTSC